ncbi:MAG: TatD family hydrolase [Candidatus Cloacimonetes bacterium]|nr:TatD family hydrolase [Candidatus Cloacimonadota bacterium]
MNKFNGNNLGEINDCWIDGHCHLCNEPLTETFDDEIDQAYEYDIKLFLSTALNRNEIDWHLDNIHPEIKLVAGIHPFYDKSNIKDFDYLVEQCRNKKLWGIGEVGYDNRKNNHNYQKNILYQQLELAVKYDLPVVFHVVHRYNELYQTLKNDFPTIRGFIHGFNGSLELVEMLSRLDIGFSLGYKILQNKDAYSVIRRIIRRGLVVFETDSPFQKSPESANYLTGLSFLIDSISDLCEYYKEDLMDKQWSTFRKISS